MGLELSEKMGRISRIGSNVVASSMTENEQQPRNITCTTFNILAPIYKRLNHEVVLFLLFCTVHLFHIYVDEFLKWVFQISMMFFSGPELPGKRLQRVLVEQEP